MFSLVRPASSETRRPVSSRVEITTFSIPELQAFMSRSAFALVRGSRLYWYLAIVRILAKNTNYGRRLRRGAAGLRELKMGGSSLSQVESERAGRRRLRRRARSKELPM